MTDDLIGLDIGSYRITSSLGVGGMGTVYLAVHGLIGKRVAIKILHSEFADKPDVIGRFFNEARAVSLLRHPHIIELLDFGKMEAPARGTLHYCVMELLEGESLRARLQRERLTEALIIHITRQIAEALAAAHRQQIIHRDLKPENVHLVGPDKDFVKLLDFGIAKLHDQTGAAAVQTQAGTLLGTPAYMSPEQCMGRPVDPRSDIYSLGIMLFEMCTGRVPFVGAGYADLLVRHVTEPAPPVRTLNPALSPGIERIVARALEKDPAARFQSMDELLAALTRPEMLAGTVPGPSAATMVRAEAPTIVNASAPDLLGNRGGGIAPPQGSTISQVSGEVAPKMTGNQPTLIRPPGESRRPGGLIAAGIAVGILAIGGLGYALFRPRAPIVTNPPAQNPNPPAIAAKPKMAHLQITSEPSDAQVKRGDTGEILGTTPLEKDLPADGTFMSIVIHKDGYQDEARGVRLTERDASLSFALKPVVAPSHSPPPTTTAPPGPTGTSRRSRPTGTPRPPSHRLNDDILSPQL
jgi:serine/threonine protein kinase